MIRKRIFGGTLLLVGTLQLGMTGCITSKTAEEFAGKVNATPAPQPLALNPLRELKTNGIPRMLVASEAAKVQRPFAKQFVAAREAFWNYDTDTAVALWRGLLTNSLPPQEKKHYQNIIIDAYAADHRWREMRGAIEEFGLAAKRSNYVARLRFLEAKPPREISFVAPTNPPFELRSGQWVIAKARINGVEAKVFVDTGATGTLLSEKFAQRAGVEISMHPIWIHDVHGSTGRARIGIARELEFGGLRARNVQIVATPNDWIKSLHSDIDAIVGWDLLQHADVTWDFPARQLSIKEPPASRATNATLSGRLFPLLNVTSAEGRSLDLFMDTGWASHFAEVALCDYDGLLPTKVDTSRVRWPWRPSISFGLHSVGASWPKMIRPFEFWFDGHVFHLERATISKRVDSRERLQTCDGVIGNAPFLGGKLRVCGLRRLASFEPTLKTNVSK